MATTGVAAVVLVNKVRTDIAMRATKLNAQVQLTNLQSPNHVREGDGDLKPAAAARPRVPGLGAAAGAGTAYGRWPWAKPPRGLARAVGD